MEIGFSNIWFESQTMIVYVTYNMSVKFYWILCWLFGVVHTFLMEGVIQSKIHRQIKINVQWCSPKFRFFLFGLLWSKMAVLPANFFLFQFSLFSHKMMPLKMSLFSRLMVTFAARATKYNAFGFNLSYWLAFCSLVAKI